MLFPVWQRLIAVIGLVALFSVNLKAQRFTVESILLLPEEVNESSGIVFLNDKLITHNDSGDEAFLYEVDPENGTLLRKLSLINASNVDWEDMAFDQQFIYVADIGNHNGDRRDLRIYRISLLNYFQVLNNQLPVDTIKFFYEDQMDFDSNAQTNFDAEAIISYEDSIYIFTKNWGDFHSNIYSIPKTPGEFSARRVGRINTEGLITGAVYNPASQEIMLTGYTLTEPFLYRLSQFTGSDFHLGRLDRLTFDLQGSFQIEGIEAINDTNYYVTSESSVLGGAELLRLSTDFLVNTTNRLGKELKIYPNPASQVVNISGLSQPDIQYIKIISPQGGEVRYWRNFNGTARKSVEIPISGLSGGLYHLEIVSGQRQLSHKLLVAQ